MRPSAAAISRSRSACVSARGFCGSAARGRFRCVPSLRTREARRALRNPRFDRLARDFDEVVYGRRAPRPEDVAAARTEWPRVLAEVRQ